MKEAQNSGALLQALLPKLESRGIWNDCMQIPTPFPASHISARFARSKPDTIRDAESRFHHVYRGRVTNRTAEETETLQGSQSRLSSPRRFETGVQGISQAKKHRTHQAAAAERE